MHKHTPTEMENKPKTAHLHELAHLQKMANRVKLTSYQLSGHCFGIFNSQQEFNLPPTQEEQTF